MLLWKLSQSLNTRAMTVLKTSSLHEFFDRLIKSDIQDVNGRWESSPNSFIAGVFVLQIKIPSLTLMFLCIFYTSICLYKLLIFFTFNQRNLLYRVILELLTNFCCTSKAVAATEVPERDKIIINLCNVPTLVALSNFHADIVYFKGENWILIICMTILRKKVFLVFAVQTFVFWSARVHWSCHYYSAH